VATVPAPSLRIVASLGMGSIERGHFHTITVHPHIGPSDTRMLLPQHEQIQNPDTSFLRESPLKPQPKLVKDRSSVGKRPVFESLLPLCSKCAIEFWTLWVRVGPLSTSAWVFSRLCHLLGMALPHCCNAMGQLLGGYVRPHGCCTSLPTSCKHHIGRRPAVRKRPQACCLRQD
jgi:hypothetical protein